MELTVKLAISSEEFFSALYKSIINDVLESADKTINKTDVKENLTYNKLLKTRIGSQGKAKVLIKEFKPNKIYTTHFISSLGTNIVTYEIIEEDNDGILIRYSESYLSEERLKKYNYKIMSFIFSRSNKKRAYSSLKTIENYIVSNRKQEND